MSETVKSGVAISAVSSCAWMLGKAALAVQKSLKDVIRKMAEGDPQVYRELKRLTMEKPTTQACSAAGARRKLGQMEKRLKQSMKASGSQLLAQPDLIPLIALQKNPLACFIDPADIGLLEKGEPWSSIGQQVLKKASRRMADVSCKHVVSSIMIAAEAQGFRTVRRYVRRGQGVHVSMADDKGRAVMALAQSGDDGTSLHIDLTGLTNNACHGTMENLLQRMHQDGVQLTKLVRQPHQQRPAKQHLPAKLSLPTIEPKPKSAKRQEFRRRHQVQNNTQARRCLKIRS